MNPIITVGVYLVGMAVVFVQAAVWAAGTSRGRFAKLWGKIFAAAAVLLAALPVAGAFLPDGNLKYDFQAAGNIWLGYFVYVFMVMLAMEVILLAVRILRHRRRKQRHVFLLFPLLVIPAVIAVYGMIHAQDIRVNRYTVVIDKPEGDISQMKIVLVGDLHISVNSRPSTIRSMVEKINAEEPDLVLVAGDVFTSSYGAMRTPELYAEILRDIRAREGVYAVYGNHDVEETLFGGFPVTPIRMAFRTEEMEQFFADAGFHVLYDEYVTVGGNVLLAGRADGEKAGDGTARRLSPEALLEGADKDLPCIVLQHEPVEFRELKEAGADLALCGHTHNGQIFPGNLIVPFFNENAYGSKKVGGLDTIVTSGIGYYGPPMRVGTDAEIAVIHLRIGGQVLS